MTKKYTFTTRGIDVTVDLDAFPADILDRLLEYGVKQKVQDSAASALGLAFDKAHPKHGLLGNKLKEAKAAWADTDEGRTAIRKTAQAMMDAAIEALQNGEWSERSANPDETFTMAEESLYATVSTAAVRKGFAKLDRAFKAASGWSTAERKRHMLDTVKTFTADEAAQFTKKTGLPLSL